MSISNFDFKKGQLEGPSQGVLFPRNSTELIQAKFEEGG